MTITSRREDLTSSFAIFLPLLLFSLASGLLFDVSKWFGCVFILLAISIFAATRRIGYARKVNVKLYEIALLGCFIPLFASLLGVSMRFFYPAINAISLAIVSFILPHLALLWRMRAKINHVVLICSSSFQLFFNIGAAGFSYKLGVVAILVNITIASYAIVTLCGAIFMLREKVNIPVLRWISLFMMAIFIASSIAGYCKSINLMLSSIAASITFTLLFAFLDFMHYQMRIPSEKWTAGSTVLPTCTVALKFLSVILIVNYAAIGGMSGALGEYGISLRAVIDGISLRAVIAIHVLLIITLPLHTLLYWLVRFGDFQNTSFFMFAEELSKKRIVAGIFAIIAVISIKIAIAAYYLTSFPSNYPEPILIAAAASLLLILIYLLDKLNLLTRHSWKVFTAIVGFALYIAIYSYTLDGSFYPQEKGVNDSSMTAQSVQGILSAASGNHITVGSILEVNPAKRLAFISVLFCLGLVAHVCGARLCENTVKKVQSDLASQIGAIVGGLPPGGLASLQAAAAPLVMTQRVPTDSDYDSESDEKEARRAII